MSSYSFSEPSSEPTEYLAPPAPPSRQPNLGYTLLLVVIGVALGLLLSLGYGTWAGMHGIALRGANGAPKINPRASLLIEGGTFLGTLGIALALFPRMWRRGFWSVLRWNANGALRNIAKLVPLGFALSFGAQFLETRMTLPKKMPMDEFFKTRADIWFVAIFATLIAPVMEEIFFRGFLLRGVAIAYDWLATPRTEAGRLRWITTDGISRPAMIFSGVITSGMFAALHGQQLAWTWSAVAILWLVGGILTAVRMRLNSVAASSLVHATYNGTVFVVLFFATGGFRHLDRVIH